MEGTNYVTEIILSPRRLSLSHSAGTFGNIHRHLYS